MDQLTEYDIQIKFKDTGSEKVAQNITKIQNGVEKLKSVIKAIGIGAILKKGFKTITGFVNKTSDYIETMNLFRQSMGSASKEAENFIKDAEDLLGLDPKNLMDSISAFQNLSEGIGISSDRAYTMSKNLTQLSADLSSFANISFEEAQSKLMSGFAGQVLPLRRYGIALDQASLQETAYALGLQQRVQEMTRAQKTELIYYQIMSSTTKMQGDLARTLDSPANALRVMRNEFNKLGREIGLVFIPIALKIIPVIIAITEIILDAVKAIASLFNIHIEDYVADAQSVENTMGGIGAGIDDIGDSADSTSKKLNKMLMPFDELNNITSDSGSGSGGIGGIGGGLGIDLPSYDMFGDISSKIRKDVEDIKSKIKSLLPVIIGVGLAILGVWALLKISQKTKDLKNLGRATVSLKTGLNNLLTSLGKAATIIALLGGLALVIESITHLIEAFSKSGLSLTDTLILVGGTILIVVGAFTLLWLMMKNFDPSIKSIAGSAVIFLGLALILSQLDGVIEALSKNSDDLTGVLIGLGVVLLEVAALGLALVLLGNTLQSPMAMAGVLVITIAIVAILFTLAHTLNDILEPLGTFINKISPSIISVIEAISRALDSVIHQIGEVLPPIIDALGRVFDKIFTGIAVTVNTVGNTVSSVVQTIGLSTTMVLSSIQSLIQQIGATIENVAHTIVWFFNNIGPAINKFANSLMNTTTNIVNFVIQAIEFLVNRVTDGTNSLANVANKIPGVNIGRSSYISISRFYPTFYAKGGFPETGQIFIANEAGPELIGNIGNRTAVANKDQITTAIANATYQAISRALAENKNGDEQPIIVNVGNEQLYKGYARYRSQQSNMYGINV